MIQVPHQCCSCLELIAVVVSKVFTGVIHTRYIYSSDEVVPSSSPDNANGDSRLLEQFFVFNAQIESGLMVKRYVMIYDTLMYVDCVH